ncbi:MAG: PL29 family lyase N-terminal domain-containing protein [Clostridium sp.]|nr:PL29 family lyase N-terminal domain-containing protein [Bacteroides sp.]MCM1197348.1 PL29 family lyase N-terminal domain-containing protein [Clostridium sp.]
MKRIFISLLAAAAILPYMTSCTDLSGVEGRLDVLEERVAAMTNSVMELNDNVKALQAFSQSGQTVKEIRQDGNVWTITLGDGSMHRITVENGPVLLNVGIDSEGYWTLDGQRILSDGKPVKATGEKGDKGEAGDKGDNGSDGNDGADGADGRTPIFGVDSEGYWTVRYDENEEPERITDVNGGYVLAVGSGSGSGDSFFKSVSIVDGELVIVLNSNQDKVFRLPVEGSFGISVSKDEVVIIPGATVEIPFEVKGMDATTRIFVEAYGYSAVLKDGSVSVTAPAQLPADGYVIVKAIRNSDSSYKAVCITFEDGIMSCVADVQTVGKDGGNVEVTITTNIEYKVAIPENVSWIHVAPSTKAVTTDVVTLSVDANDGEMRSATVSVVPALGETYEVKIVQYGVDDVVFEKVDLASVAKFAVSGSAVAESVEMTQTLENEDVYAFWSDLKAGEMYIEMLDGESASLGALVPAEGTDINPATAQAIDQDFVALTAQRHWTIPADGKYRIVLNRASGEVTIYDEANDLQPVKAEYYYAGNEKSWFLSKTLTPGKYYISTMTGWDSWKGKAFDFAASLADPQILYSTSTLAITDGFCIKVAQSVNEVEILAAGTEVDPAASGTMDFVSKTFAFCPATEPGVVTAGDIAITTDEWIPMAQAVSNRKWKPAERIEIKTIIIDARNNKIFFKL